MSDFTDTAKGDDVGRFEAMRRERDRLKRQLGETTAELNKLRGRLHMVQEITDTIPDPPEWLAPVPSGKHIGTPVLVLSDTHYDEVVNPTEMFGLNKYDRDIAHDRTRRAFEGAVTLPQRYIGASLKKRGIVVAHGGDLITGEIHDELVETNEAKPPDTILEFVDDYVAGLRLLRKEYGKVHVVVVDGNHDRLYKKKRSKGAARDSWSWLFWQIVAREFRNMTTVSFQIPEGRDVIFPVHDTRFLLHHGDEFRGGGGIAGPLTPIAIGHYRKSRKHADAVRYTGNDKLRFDLILQGHVHHRNSIPGVVTVGALKGYDEFAHTKNFPFEPASQELLIVTPERGVTFQAPIYVQDPAVEGWADQMDLIES